DVRRIVARMERSAIRGLGRASACHRTIYRSFQRKLESIEMKVRKWIPAFAGMTSAGFGPGFPLRSIRAMEGHGRRWQLTSFARMGGYCFGVTRSRDGAGQGPWMAP